VIRDAFGNLADWAFERTLDLNVVSSFGKVGFVMRSRHFERHALDVDLTGRVCLVTGANAGLGYATCRGLAERGATVYLLCRSEERGQAALESLRQETKSESIHLALVDVSEADSIRRFANEFPEERVDVLVNNAGILPDERTTNSGGIEMTWATNILGAYLLTKLLVPKLETANGRVVLVSSGGMYMRKLDLDDWAREQGEFDGVAAYANTKRAMVILAEEWAEGLGLRGITINSMHPGWVDTAGVRSSLPRFHRYTKSILRNWRQGADTILWLAISAEAAEHQGQFFFDRELRRTHLFPWAKEAEADRGRLLALLEEQTPG